MRAIILAGGLGTRLGKYTQDLPKCMLKFLGKTLIERQVETLRDCGINAITITRKHLKEKINLLNVEYDDKGPDDTNMLDDFIHAIKNFEEDIILCYGDILYEPRVLKELMKSKSEIAVVADEDWKEYWIERLGSWRKDSESFVISKANKLISLGKPNPPEEQMHARYVGLIKFSKKILPKIIEIYKKNSKDFWEKPWHTSPSFKKAYMTDFLQELIDIGIEVKAVKIKRGWIEFDTVEDYELTSKWGKEGELARFIDLS